MTVYREIEGNNVVIAEGMVFVNLRSAECRLGDILNLSKKRVSFLTQKITLILINYENIFKNYRRNYSCDCNI